MNREARLEQIRKSNDKILTRITVLRELLSDEEAKLRKNFKEEAALIVVS